MTKAVPSGMKPFQDWIYEGHPEYAIFAVKAPIEAVGQSLVDDFGVKEWRKCLDSDKSISESMPKERSHWFPILQMIDSDWTVVYWYVGAYMNVSNMSKKLSSSFHTRVIFLVEEDTSGAIGYGIYEKDELLEEAECCPGEDLFFESKIREEPEIDDFETDEGEAISQVFNQFFIEEGISIPTYSMKVADASLSRVDLMKLS